MSLYQSKIESYFSAARKDILDVIPAFSRKVLEIGCGSGQTLELLKQQGLCEQTFGIELFEQAAENARTRVDHVYCLDIEKQDVPVEIGQVDLILMLDVLEHLVDPWRVLTHVCQKHLRPGGKVLISLPNVRHFSCVLPLLVKGEFSYQERGVLDKTHLRFFTRISGAQLIQEAGLKVEKIKPTSLEWSLNTGKLNALTLGVFAEFLTSQFIYLACPAES